MADPQVRVMSAETIISSSPSGLTLILYKPLSGTSSITSEGSNINTETNARSLLGNDNLEEEEEEFEERDEIPMLVSSRVMAESSKVFAAMLSVNFAEGTELANAGSATIVLPEDSPTAIIPLLHLLHSHSPLVPKRLALGELIEIAILVDKYEMGDAVKDFAATHWTKCLVVVGEDGLVYMKESEVVGILFVTFVFGMAAQFERAVRWAIFRYSENDFNEHVKEGEGVLGIRLPGWTIESINVARRRIIDVIFDFLKIWFYEFPISGTQCRHTDPHCDAFFIGTLLLSASKAGLWPPPEDGLMPESKPRELINKVKSLKVKTLCPLTCEDLGEGRTARGSFDGVWGMVEMKKMVIVVKDWEVMVKAKPIEMSWYFTKKRDVI